jgi:hypothetical protein
VWGGVIVAPPTGSLPLPRWPWGHCQYPTDWVPPHISFLPRQGAGHVSVHCHVSCGSEPCLHVEEGSSTAMHPTTPDLASLPRWALALPRAMWLRTLPPYQNELRHCQVPCSIGHCLPAEAGFGAATCPHGTGPHLPVGEGSSAATCLVVLSHTSLPRRALTLPRVPWPSVGRGSQV